jgi:hypothetical protein
MKVLIERDSDAAVGMVNGLILGIILWVLARGVVYWVFHRH